MRVTSLKINSNQPLRIATLDEYRKVLSKPDAILEENIYTDALSEYLKLGGAPMDAVNLLSESYLGIPSMCNAIAESVNSIGLNKDLIMRRAIRTLLTERFDPQLHDEPLMKFYEDKAPEKLDSLFQDSEWRQTMYRLLEKYPNSAFVNFVVLRMVEAGYEKEISKLRTSSTYMKVYNLILNDALSELVTKDDLEFDEDLPRLINICCEREDTYLYTQILLRRLYDEYGVKTFNRLRRELELVAKKRGNTVVVDILHTNISDAPLELSKTMKNMMNSSNITQGDLIALKRFYLSENPPATHYLCNYDFILKLLKVLYVPQHGTLLRRDLVDDTTFIIAYATTMNDTKPRNEQQDDILKIQLVLKDLYTALANKTIVGSITGATKYIISAIRFPVGSMGVLLWIEYMAIHTSYFETYFRTKEPPVLLLILDEIASRHQLQQPVVFSVIKRCVKHKTDNFAPELQLSLQRAWVDRMLYLVQLHYTIPVLKYFSGPGRELDDSLIIYFIKKVLKLAQPPYTSLFIHHMVLILESLVQNLNLIKDVQQLVINFLEQSLHGQEDLDDKLQTKINEIISQLHKELKKQRIEDTEFDFEDTEEKLAGVFSSDDSDNSDSEDEQTKRYKKRARKVLIKTMNELADAAGSSEDEDEDEDEDEEDNKTDEEEEEENDTSDEEMIETYSCDICPDKKLKTEKQVEDHLQSKSHLRRLRYLERQKEDRTEKEKEELTKEKEEARLLKKREKDRKRRLIFKKKKKARLQAALKAAEAASKQEKEEKKEKTSVEKEKKTVKAKKEKKKEKKTVEAKKEEKKEKKTVEAKKEDKKNRKRDSKKTNK
ncbi:TH1 protein-domain-containing protein [Cokeromyces recurvatus]|uniref:TH1 protein-domain-containing protein n=1 Tax=Cokeromyces recurvatus TaxID=90255 RepID=UPI00221F1210|nr:TH1 protein-domain-containing protein [Cokeromyces recurvatus]KAI7904504.1 TH1 protein-domain-containing protein [Cokeromyces recurvatus]